ncbi:hypothetical protein ABKN59_007558 [Abortiporus biennis]
MSHLTSDKNVPTSTGKPLGSLVPTQEKITVTERKVSTKFSYLIPPQEEKQSVEIPGHPSLLERGIHYFQEQSAKHPLEYVTDSDTLGGASLIQELARDKAISDAVRAGAAGVTGEDFGIDEKRRIY